MKCIVCKSELQHEGVITERNHECEYVVDLWCCPVCGQVVHGERRLVVKKEPSKEERVNAR